MIKKETSTQLPDRESRLIGDRARQLAERHPLTADGCSSCARPGCVAARMAVEALELLEQGERLRT